MNERLLFIRRLIRQSHLQIKNNAGMGQTYLHRAVTLCWSLSRRFTAILIDNVNCASLLLKHATN